MLNTNRIGKLAVFLTVFCCLLMTSINASAKTTINHMHYSNHDPRWYAWLQERAAVFETLNPDIEVEFIVSVGTGVNQLLNMAAGGTLPDVTELALVYGGTFAGRGFFEDLKPFIDRDPDVNLDMFAPIAPEATTWSNGEVWGLPVELYTAPTFFNKNLVAEAGLPYPNEIGDDWNWDAVIDFGRKLSQDTNLDGEFDRKGLAGLSGMWAHMAVVRQAGGSLFDSYIDPQVSHFNTPEVETAIQWLVDLYSVHGVLESGYSTAFSENTAGITFVSGPAGMPSFIEAGIDIDVALQPLGPESRAAYSVVNSFQIIKDSPNAEEAWKWIKFLATEIESVEKFVLSTGRLPALLSVARYYRDYVDNPPDNIELILLNVLDPASFHLPIGPNAEEARQLIPMTPLTRGDIDVRSALEEAHRRATSILAK